MNFKNLMFKNKINILSSIIILLLGLFFFNVDYQYSPDVLRNINFAQKFIDYNFDFQILLNNLIKEQSLEFNIIFAIFIYSIGLLIDNLPLLFFIINLTTTILLFHLIKKDFSIHNIPIFYFHIFCYLFLLNPDLRLWQSYLLTDYFFTILIFVYFRFLINQNFLIAFILLLFLLLVRPTSIFILPITFIFLFFNNTFKVRNKFQFNFLIIASCIAFIFIGLIFLNYNEISFLGRKFSYYRNFNIDGIVVHKRWSVNYNIDNIVNFFSFFLIKFLAFHQFLSSKFSVIHNIYNLFYYSPYLFITFLIFKKIYFKSNFQFNLYYLLSFYVFLIYSVCHSLLLIDYDWRYRMPLYIPLIVSIVYFLYEIKLYDFIKKILLLLDNKKII